MSQEQINPFSNIKYILWDNDGVLVDTEQFYYEAGRVVMEEHGLDLTHDHFKEHSLRLGQSVFDVASAAGFSKEQCDVMRTRRDHLYTEYLKVEDIFISDIDATVSKIAPTYRMCIVSSSLKNNFYVIHDRTENLLRHYEFQLLSGDYPRSKPHPDPWLTAADKLGAQPDECIVIEDSPRGIQAAKAAGMKVVAVESRFFKEEDLKEYLTDEDFCLKSIHDLPELLKTGTLESTPETVKVLSYGCAANFGEGEMIAGLLDEDGHHLVKEKDNSQTTVMNICTVKGNSSAMKEIKRVLDEDPNTKLVLTGCMTKDLEAEVKKIRPDASVTTTHKLTQIPDIVNKTEHGEAISDYGRTKDVKVNLPRKAYNPVVGIVPVCSGCLDHCTFCSTRLVKGTLYSFPEEDIIADVLRLVQSGAQEIWITGQDSACYGFEREGEDRTNLARLMKKILQAVPGDYFIRIGMGNPRHLMEYVDELVEVFEDPRVFKFIHLPVQAGSDSVLQGMNRKHSVEDYYFLVDALRKRYHEFTISTDIILGFPGETDEDFEQTMELMRKTRPSVCNRTRFVARKGTAAAKMTDIPKAKKKERSAALTHLFKEIAEQNNQEWIGWKGEVLVDEEGKNGTWQARNYAYKQIVLKGDHKIGDRVQVEVIRADIFYLEAKAI